MCRIQPFSVISNGQAEDLFYDGGSAGHSIGYSMKPLISIKVCMISLIITPMCIRTLGQQGQYLSCGSCSSSALDCSGCFGGKRGR